MSHATRGQATVETVLGLLVFVTVLIFGIHFAEVGFLSLKVQEAANFALYAPTQQRQLHDTFAHDYTLYRSAVASANTQANARYRDFDALASRRSGRVTQVFTQADDLQVDCRPLDASDRFEPQQPHPFTVPAFPDGLSGISCSARAVLTSIRIPQTFADGEPFRAQHHRRVAIPVCAVGRPVSQQCSGRLGVLLDDWGYRGPREAQDCALAWEGGTECANQGYYDQVSQTYLNTPVAHAGSASRLGALMAGASPIDEDFFFMSFRGFESPNGPFTETVRFSHGDLLWETTPYANPHNNRHDAPRTDCWLGKDCP